MLGVLPYKERIPDNQYKQLLRTIIEEGEEVGSQQGTNAITKIAPPPLHYKFENGYPLITERNMAPKVTEAMPVTIYEQAIAEIFAFTNGASTLEELEEYGCFWWRHWAGNERKCKKRGLKLGELGPGSYGPAFKHFPDGTEKGFNQWEALLDEARDNPGLRTLFVSSWIPQYIPRGPKYKQRVIVVPCHGMVHVRILNGKLTVHMMQRSADTILGVPSNIAQYAALALALGQALNLPVEEYVHSFSDAHIYVDHLDAAKEMLARESRPFPTMEITSNKTDFFAFRREDFKLTDYNPHKGIKGLVAAI